MSGGQSNGFEPFAIDLVSDNASRPTAAMRELTCAADAGDEEPGEDPTVRELEGLVADLTGKPAALFLPSGTMCNIIAFAVWCVPGDRLLLHDDTHPSTRSTPGHTSTTASNSTGSRVSEGCLVPRQSSKR